MGKVNMKLGTFMQLMSPSKHLTLRAYLVEQRLVPVVAQEIDKVKVENFKQIEDPMITNSEQEDFEFVEQIEEIIEDP